MSIWWQHSISAVVWGRPAGCRPQGGIAVWWEMKSFSLQSPDLAHTSTRVRPDWAISINGIHTNSLNTERKTGKERKTSKQSRLYQQTGIWHSNQAIYTDRYTELPSFCAAPCASPVCREITACGDRRAPQRRIKSGNTGTVKRTSLAWPC